MTLTVRSSSVALLLCLLAACGGGGGSGGAAPPPTQPPVSNPGPTPTPNPDPDPTPDPTPDPPDPTDPTDPDPTPDPTPTAEDLANAGSSQLEMIQRAYGQQLVIKWVDTFAAESGFRVEARSADGTFQTVESLPASPGTGSAYQWHRVLDVSKDYRVSAVKTGYTVPLETPAGQSAIPIELSSSTLSLNASWDEDMNGTVLMFVSSQTSGFDSVTYSVDGDVFGVGTPDRSFSVDWDSTSVPDGKHMLLARARKTSGAILEAEQRVRVDNPNLVTSLNVSYRTGSSTELLLAAIPTSDAGIESVQFLVNDTLVQTLTSATVNGRYEHTLATAGLPAGTSTFRAIARDNNGVTAEATRQLSIDNPPTLSVNAPLQGVVDWDLEVWGTFADDRPGAALTVTVGDSIVLQTSTPGTFYTTYSLASWPMGEYTLTFRVVDADGAQTVKHQNIVLQTEPQPTLGVGNGARSILAAGDWALLWEHRDGTFLYRDYSGNSTIFPVPSGLSQFTSWALRGPSGIVQATGPAPSTDTHIYTFGIGAPFTNISQATGSTINVSPILRLPWVIWHAGTGATARYEIYNTFTQARVSVPPPAGTTLGNIFFDFVNTPGAEQLFFWAISGSGSTAVSDVYRYDLASATTTLVTSGGSRHRFIETDNQRVAWRNHLGNGVFQLFSAPVANPTDITTHSSTMQWFTLSDGQLVWTESNGNETSVLKVNEGTTTTIVSTEASVTTLATAPACASIGQITFAEHGTIQLWDSVRGKREVLHTLPPYGFSHHADVAFFGFGTEALSLFRLDLP